MLSLFVYWNFGHVIKVRAQNFPEYQSVSGWMKSEINMRLSDLYDNFHTTKNL